MQPGYRQAGEFALGSKQLEQEWSWPKIASLRMSCKPVQADTNFLASTAEC